MKMVSKNRITGSYRRFAKKMKAINGKIPEKAYVAFKYLIYCNLLLARERTSMNQRAISKCDFFYLTLWQY